MCRSLHVSARLTRNLSGVRGYWLSCTFTIYTNTWTFPTSNWYRVCPAHRASIITVQLRVRLRVHCGLTSGIFPTLPHFPDNPKLFLESLHSSNPRPRDGSDGTECVGRERGTGSGQGKPQTSWTANQLTSI